MKTIVFADRVMKEIIRDPISLFFGLAFPLILLVLLSAINSSIPADLFNISSLAPGIAVFGLSFMALFAAQVLAKDRASSFLTRLFTTPMTAHNFILGYMLPLITMSVIQVAFCLLAALFLGLDFTITIFAVIIIMIPMAFVYIGIGLICGTLFTEKAAVGICGALLTNVSAWLSGVWFDLELVGGIFMDIANVLPFVHSVEVGKAVLNGHFTNMFPHLWWVISYAVIIMVISIIVFKKKTQEV
ncbi:ABC transporter permease [Robertmurraya andreesenii]|uniref:Transport permease protein n=1 Tax=Anoxybacillus andreesenii TaxID=1325932 RepID=A0ABT9UZW2_9BACL|nr:ABC transporter permease [Robertmurraya andreesenii]MDQ0154240.1 ABC-2 type transport system permease protein [Robertmurraya andreesenii]